EFRQAAVESLLAPKETGGTGAALLELERRELVVPSGREDGRFWFTHILVRDAAYDLIPKERRAELHIRYADWLIASGARHSDRDELVGDHIAQAIPALEEL